MSNSQNGWPVDKSGANQDRNPIYGSVKVPNGVLKGDVAVVLRYVAKRYHETVEPLRGGTCWGWFVKPIEGSASISNHASGTAIDLNADQHPMGVAASKTFSAKEIAACRAIVKACDGAVRWGGDYSGRPDSMHWEVVGSKAATAALAKKIRAAVAPQPQEDDVELSDHIGNKAYASRTVGTFANDLQGVRDVLRGDETGTKAAAYPATAPLMRLLAVPAQLATLTAAVTALTGKDFTDEQAIVTGVLAGLDPAAIAAAVAAALPADQAKQVADELASRLAA